MILKYLRSKKSYMKEIEYWKKLYHEEHEKRVSEDYLSTLVTNTYLDYYTEKHKTD